MLWINSALSSVPSPMQKLPPTRSQKTNPNQFLNSNRPQQSSKPKTMAAIALPLLLLLLFSPFSTSSQTPKINLWPKPTTISWPNPTATTLSPSFRILSPNNHRHLRRAARRYLRLILSENHRPLLPQSLTPHPSSAPLTTLTISVSDLSSPLTLGVDESYSLTVSSPSANLTSATPWGAIRGLETFSQLAWGRDPVCIPSDLWIHDRPIFPHRGLMLDTSRNFYPVEDILRTIDAMAANKLNVFHWHITDSQSFPIILSSEPELASKGSYGPEMRYSRADVRRIVRFAARRGVRVIPEFDAPGHTGSWAGAYPEIVTCAGRFWAPTGSDSLAAEPGTGQLNPLHPKTYQVLHNVLRDAADLFPDTFFHAGADEVNPACWKTDPDIQNFLANNGTLSKLLEIFINNTHPFITGSLGRTAVYWEDVLLDKTVKVDSSLLPPGTTVLQTWNNGPKNTKLIVSTGYRVIVSSSDFYYLDCGHGGFVSNDSRYDKQVGDDGPSFNYAGGNGGSWCAPFKTWQRVYVYDITHGLDEEEAKLVLGGEVALWSEQADATVLDARVWPRASAMAEALWSGNKDESGKKRYAEAAERLNEWRYRMVARGVRAEPIQPLWCSYNPGTCNLVQ